MIKKIVVVYFLYIVTVFPQLLDPKVGITAASA